MSTPRNLGHVCLALDPARFAGQDAYDAAMIRYLAALRGSSARAGEQVMAPGDREWAVETERLRNGVPVDRTRAAFLGLG